VALLTNNIPQRDGGNALAGSARADTGSSTKYATKTRQFAKKSKVEISGDDEARSLTCVAQRQRCLTRKFSSQTKQAGPRPRSAPVVEIPLMGEKKTVGMFSRSIPRTHEIMMKNRRGRPPHARPPQARELNPPQVALDNLVLPGKLARNARKKTRPSPNLHRRKATFRRRLGKQGRRATTRPSCPLRGKILKRRARRFDKMALIRPDRHA